MQQKDGSIEVYFFGESKQLEKTIIFIAKGVLLAYEVRVQYQPIQETYLPFPVKAMQRTYDEVKGLIEYIFNLNICQGQSTKGK